MEIDRYKKVAAPSEDEEQAVVIEWCELNSHRYPELKMIYHVPNEGKRSAAYAAKEKRLGLKKGVPDLVIPVKRMGFAGLYIEMKKIGGRLTREQRIWLDMLNDEGYAAFVAEGAEQAIKIIQGYLNNDIDAMLRYGIDKRYCRASADGYADINTALLTLMCVLMVMLDFSLNRTITGLSIMIPFLSLLYVVICMVIEAFERVLIRRELIKNDKK